MGSLLRRVLAKLGLIKVNASILILGIANSGKSTIVKRLAGSDDVEQVAPTLGFCMEEVRLHGVRLKILDMSGASKYQELWQYYYSETKALVFVVDSSDLKRLAEAQAVLAGLLQEPLLQGRPLLIFSSKTDSAQSLPVHEVVAALQLPQIMDRAMQVQGCSAHKNTGVQEGMKWLLERC